MTLKQQFRRLKEWMAKRQFCGLVGLEGVSKYESTRARRLGVFFTYTSVLVAIALLLEWQWEFLEEFQDHEKLIFNWVIWGYFVFQFTLLTTVVRDKWRFIRRNWFFPLVIFLGIPFVLHYEVVMSYLVPFRPLLAIAILLPSITILARFFIDGKLRTTLLATAVIVVIFGLLVAGVDPNINSPWDGIWWAVATVSTVGYGDIVPSSELGRLIGIGLIVLGLGVFVVITANFLALTLRKETEKFKEEEREVDQLTKDVQDLKSTQHEILLLLKSLQAQYKKQAKTAEDNRQDE